MSNFECLQKLIHDECVFNNLKNTLKRFGIMKDHVSWISSASSPLTLEMLEEAAEKAKENFGRPDRLY